MSATSSASGQSLLRPNSELLIRAPLPSRRGVSGICSPEQRERRCCRRGWWRCFRRRPTAVAVPDTEVDPALIGDTDTDRLSAGVARLLYNHIKDPQGDTHIVVPTASLRSSNSTGSSTGSSSARPSLSSGLGRLLTSSDFEEVHFLAPSQCPCSDNCLARALQSPLHVSANDIFRLLRIVAAISEYRKEVIVLGAIYVERLLNRNPELSLTSTNWRPILVASLHVASKTWEDVHPWNAEVAAFLRSSAGLSYSARSLYELESLFLSGLGYRVDVPGELYASYYFSLQERTVSPPPELHHGGSLPSSPNLSPCLNALSFGKQLPRSRQASNCSVHQIVDLEALHEAPEPRAMLVRCSTWNHALNSPTSGCGSGDFSRFRMDSEGSTMSPQQSQAMPASPSGASSRSSFQSNAPIEADLALSPATTRSGLEGSGSARRTRRKLQLDPQNPYVGFFRHASRAPPPSSYIKQACTSPATSTPQSAKKPRTSVTSVTSV